MNTELKESTKSAIQDLITANIDSSEQLKSAAQEVENPLISKMFNDLSIERNANANQLKTIVTYSDNQEVSTDESITGRLRKAWLQMRAKINEGDTYTLLAEAERCEDVIKNAYEKIIVEVTGTPVNDVLHEQYRSVKAGHDRVRDFRDSFQNEK